MSKLEPTQPTRGAIPVQAKERIEFVDILRGFAVLGILVANMAGFSGQPPGLQAWSGPVDRAVVMLIRFLVTAKFYSLFSFLFGWGMAVQMARAEARGVRFVPLYLRRLFILLIFGLLHAALLWYGDILTTYALYGGLLLLFRKRSEKVLLVAAGLALLLSIVLTLPGQTMDACRAWYNGLTDFLRSDTYPESLYATGDVLDITRRRIQDFISFNSRPIYTFGNIFGMFLLGLYAGKRRILHEVAQHLPLLRKVTWAGFGIGVVLNGVCVWLMRRPSLVPSQYEWLASVGARTIGAPALMLFYVCGIILLVQKETWRQRLSPLAVVGRSALSNYLFQSILCTLIFYAYGLGLYGQTGPTFGLVLTVVIYWSQIRISEWWFDRYQFGPVEWLWRTLTYGRRQPLGRGETYDDLKPVPWLRQARQVAARVHLKIALASVVVVLLISGGTLALWHVRLEGGISNVSLDLPKVGSKAGVTPLSPEVDSESEAQAEVVATPVVRPVAYNPGPIAASGDLLALASTFSAPSAMAEIETLTGPPYLGRYAGSPQGWAAGDYIAGQFARYGLQPAGYDGTFFQSFPLEYVALAQAPSLIVEGPDGTVYDRYIPHQDFSALLRWYAGSGAANGEVVWANNCAHDDFNPLDVVDKIVLCRDVSIQLATRNAVEYGAAGVLLLTDPELRLPDFGSTYFETWVPEPIPVLRVFPPVVEDLLLGSGRSVQDLSISFAPFALSTRARMKVVATGPEACGDDGCRGRNVLGVIPGRDPAYADQVVIIGAHYDHLGQAPDGTIWVGANDDASGVAILLEIARSWQEQGYVPRRTVLFAAWDAEEEGLWGSRYYVEHPRYPLENTVAKLQLDMVGAGGDTLLVDGAGELGEKIRAVAHALGVQTEASNVGRSDHVPFLEAGVPADLLIWFFEGDVQPQYHRPMDTPDIIEPDKLEAVGKIAGITLLGLTDGELAIHNLLARRAAAVEDGDVEAFLDTSLPELASSDRFWFTDLQALSAPRFGMQAQDVRVLGRTATATVQMELEYPAGGKDGETRAVMASLSAKFTHTEDGWRWAGPDLVWTDQETGFAVAYPPGKGEGLERLGGLAAEQYAKMATLMGLPTRPDAALLLFPTSQALRVSTALSLTHGREVWVAPGTVKLVYRKELSASQQLTDTLAQLVLAEAGMTESAAPWLWQGLPLALRSQAGGVGTQATYLCQLQETLATETLASSEATSWAAVDYLRQRVGWRGIGQFVVRLGQACQDGLCRSSDAVDVALSNALGLESSAFERAWQGYWREHLATARANLDAVLSARTEAILAGDEASFLSTVDPDVPGLVAEEQGWFADLARHPLESFSLAGEPLALLEDGRILADVTLAYRLAEATGRWSEGTTSFEVLFTPGHEGYRWAGVPFQGLTGGHVTVLYPEAGQQELAQAVLEETGTIYVQLAAELGVEGPDALTVKLYDSADAFRISVSLSFPPSDWLRGWAGRGESLKLRLQRDAMLEDYRPVLATQLTRHLLYQMGVDSEWLIKGVSIYLSRRFDGGLAEQAAAANLNELSRAVSEERPYGLEAMPLDRELSKEDCGLANAQAWDAVRYLVYTHGWEALVDLLHRHAEGLDLDVALQRAIGQSLREFEMAWAESVGQVHALPEWVEVARAFDPEMAKQHVEVLASPELAGRRAGSPGAEAAAAYIAARFGDYGLVPVGQSVTFLQPFPITSTTLLSAPRFEIVDENDRTVDALTYRQDFLTLLDEMGGGGTAAGELVWVRDGDYQGMELDGKIALRHPSHGLEIEVARAVEHGAAGLVLIGEQESEEALLARQPLPVEVPLETGIPVLELSRQGYRHLLAVAGQTPASLQDSPPALPLGLKARLEIPLGTPERVETANVLGVLPGSDPVLRQEVIILGAHYDHVGHDPDTLVCPAEASGTGGGGRDAACKRVAGRRYAGANDNASGVGVLLEIARLWHATGYRPQRSVLFAAWGAQELGEIGSTYYVDHPVFPLDKTMASLQLDAVGGGDGYFLEAQGIREQDGLLLFNIMGAADRVDGRLALRGPSGRGDHVPFRNVGIPTLSLTWREASEDNWPVEIADEVEPYRLGVTGRMVTLTLMGLAR